MRRQPSRTTIANEESATQPKIDLAAAVESGAINERDLVAVLTEMCRCLIAAHRRELESSPTTASGPSVSSQSPATRDRPASNQSLDAS